MKECVSGLRETNIVRVEGPDSSRIGNNLVKGEKEPDESFF
jgi:hypothetical protein